MSKRIAMIAGLVIALAGCGLPPVIDQVLEPAERPRREPVTVTVPDCGPVLCVYYPPLGEWYDPRYIQVCPDGQLGPIGCGTLVPETRPRR